MRSFLVIVNREGSNSSGRLFRITPLEAFPASGDDWVPVDCRDIRTRFEAQAIIGWRDSLTPASVIAENQVRDAIRSAYYTATSHESGRFPVGGTELADNFTVHLIG